MPSVHLFHQRRTDPSQSYFFLPLLAGAVIELEGVTKTYVEGAHRRVVFERVDATLHRGEFTVLTGRSGTGKSTLLNLISGIDLPDAGRIRIGGVALTDLSDKERTLLRRREVGFVFQFFNLIPTLTVAENLKLPLELNNTPHDRSMDRISALLDTVGLGSRADSFPDRLSGGEQQRVAIVRALAHDPSLVLADEPTGNLDSDTGREVLQLLASLTGDSGKTLIMVTHSEEAAGFADRVLAIEGGRLVDRGAAQAP